MSASVETLEKERGCRKWIFIYLLILVLMRLQSKRASMLSFYLLFKAVSPLACSTAESIHCVKLHFFDVDFPMILNEVS